MSETKRLIESIQNNLNETNDNTKYIVCSYYDEKVHGLEDELKTNDWSEATSFAHDKLMNGFMIEIENTITGKYKRINPDEYNEEFDGEFIIRPEELEESEESTLLKSYRETDYGYSNNATMIYGELTDGNWYVYIPDNDAFDIYNEPITNKFIDCSYNYQTDDDRADDTWYDNFVKEHEITKNYDNDTINKIISELDHKYYGDDFID